MPASIINHYQHYQPVYNSMLTVTAGISAAIAAQNIIDAAHVNDYIGLYVHDYGPEAEQYTCAAASAIASLLSKVPVEMRLKNWFKRRKLVDADENDSVIQTMYKDTGQLTKNAASATKLNIMGDILSSNVSCISDMFDATPLGFGDYMELFNGGIKVMSKNKPANVEVKEYKFVPLDSMYNLKHYGGIHFSSSEEISCGDYGNFIEEKYGV